jgi:two-component system cell cycle response regulator
LLLQVSKILQEGLRSTDVAARIGGDEFLLLFPQTSLQEAEQLMERIRHALVTSAIPCVGSPVSISGGLVAWKQNDSIDTLLGRADRLLYAAKNAGRNRVQAE